jgi:phosphomevalonate kinase
VSAPGKAFLCGEYAVTEGAPAVIAAVDRRVVAGTNGGDGYPSGPETSAAFLEAQGVFGRLPHQPVVDRRQLFGGNVKLGLGSSAAGAVAVAGAVAAHHRHDLTEPSVRERVFECAFRGHARVAPNGSGADVAAATHGGFVVYDKTSTSRLRTRSVAAPTSLHLSLIWTGKAMRTSELLGRVHRLRETAPESYDHQMDSLTANARTFADAFSRVGLPEVLEAARAYHAALKELGRIAAAPIVDGATDVIARIALREGGAAKPCGAGGGDVAIGFFEDPEAMERFETRCAEAGFRPIEVIWGAEGVRAE